MRAWGARRIAAAAGAELLRDPAHGTGGPLAATVDSRAAGPGDLFFGIPGERADGGAFAAPALAAGAWGALATPERAREALAAAPAGAVLAAADPTAALGALAREVRRDLGARVVGITGSTGKTSTKDILASLLAPSLRTVASQANLNTEIGLPLQVLAAPPGTQALVLEMAMRGAGQIAELVAIAEPDVGVIVNVGPVHLELLGSLEAVAAAKAELVRDLRPGGTAVVPAGEPLLEPHLRRPDIEVVTFGERGDVRLLGADGDRLDIDLAGERIAVEVSFTQAHNRANLLAALAAARAVGADPPARLDVAFSALRGERIELPDGITVIDDCYNANPMSMRAALDDLAAVAASKPGGGRRVAVLGDMLELGPREVEFHADVGRHAAAAGVELLVAVGPLAAEAGGAFPGEALALAGASEAAGALPALLEPGDTVLVKGSRGVGLEVVAQRLGDRGPAGE